MLDPDTVPDKRVQQLRLYYFAVIVYVHFT